MFRAKMAWSHCINYGFHIKCKRRPQNVSPIHPQRQAIERYHYFCEKSKNHILDVRSSRLFKMNLVHEIPYLCSSQDGIFGHTLSATEGKMRTNFGRKIESDSLFGVIIFVVKKSQPEFGSWNFLYLWCFEQGWHLWSHTERHWEKGEAELRLFRLCHRPRNCWLKWHEITKNMNKIQWYPPPRIGILKFRFNFFHELIISIRDQQLPDIRLSTGLTFFQLV